MGVKRPDTHVADELLLARLKQGDNTAFDQLYERYWRQVYSAALKRLQDADLAKDATQDVFLKLWLNREQQQIERLEAYLHTAIKNKVLHVMEKEQRYTPLPELLVLLRTNKEYADAELLERELLKTYESLIQSLTPSQQQIFRMHFQNDMSTAEIAEKLSISRKTVQNQLGKAVAIVRSSLEISAIIILACLK